MAADVSTLAHALRAALLRVPADEEPHLAAGLRAGASAAALAACEAALGMALPAPLRELLLVLDGQEYDTRVSAMPGAPWSRLLPCSAIAERFHALPDILATCEEEFAAEMPEGEHAVAADHRVGAPGCPVVAYNSHWIPFAEAYHGGGGAPLVFMLDMAPPPGVPSGRAIAVGCDDALGLWAPSLAALLADIVRVLEARYPQAVAVAAAAAAAPAAVAGPGAERRHRKVLYDDGPRIWHQYANE